MMAKTKKAAKATEDPDEARAKNEAEARAEVEKRVQENDDLHKAAEKKGAAMKPHEQEPPTAEVVHADRPADEGATVAVKVGVPDKPREVGQEELGMGPLERNPGLKGAAIQPSARTHTAYTAPATRPDGTAFQFSNPGTGTPLGTQGVKTTGAQQVSAGGPTGGGTILADVLATGDAAGPTYSDRVATDADVHAGGVIPGATNLPRAAFAGDVVGMGQEGVQNAEEASQVNRFSDTHELPKEARKTGVVLVGADRPTLPENVASDRLASADEEMTQVSTPESDGKTPNTGGGELLGMGETTFLGGTADRRSGVVSADRHLSPEEVAKGAPKAETTLASKEGEKAQRKAEKEGDKPTKEQGTEPDEQEVKVKGGAGEKDKEAPSGPMPISPPATEPQAGADTRPAVESNAPGGAPGVTAKTSK